jgi:cap1 methyltransferase
VEVKRLVLCQFLCMFMVLRKGGNFVCKIFDCFTPFTVGLLYLLYRHFEDFSILKPCTSRPANSERYVVCKNLRETCPSVSEHLKEVNRLFDVYPETNPNEVLHVVDPELIAADQQFVQYVRKCNIE